MKNRDYRIMVMIMTMLGANAASGAVPSISFSRPSTNFGELVTFSALVADGDADMDYATFAIWGPGDTSWQTLTPSIDVPGPGTSSQQTGVLVEKVWSPPSSGLYRVRLSVSSLNGSTVTERSFDVLSGSRTVGPVTVPDGVVQMFSFKGELITAQNTSADSVVVANGGALILWSGGRVVLQPGFKASSGSFFWAAVDHDMNGFSDIEEITDTDGDGMFDAWEVDHGLNPIANDAGGDLDLDGTTNLAEFLEGRNPNDKNDGAGLPTDIQLVLCTPANGYLGVKTATWEISAVAAP